MPYILINKIKNLLDMDFKVPTKGKNLILGSSDALLPEEVLNAVDDISHTAKKLFGRNIEPSMPFQQIMYRAGFPVEMVKRDNVGWKKAAIITPKGIIHYS